MQVNEITVTSREIALYEEKQRLIVLYEEKQRLDEKEKQRLDEIAPFIIGAGVILGKLLIAAGVSYISIAAVQKMVDMWRRWKFQPPANAIPDKLRIKTEGVGKHKGKFYWWQFNESEGKWRRVKRGVFGWSIIKGGKSKTMAAFADQLENALRKVHLIHPSGIGGTGWINAKAVTKEAFDYAYVMSQAQINQKDMMTADDEALKKYNRLAAQSHKAKAFKATARYLKHIAPWLLLITPFLSTITYILTSRSLAMNYWHQYQDHLKWKEAGKPEDQEKGINFATYAQRITDIRASAVIFFTAAVSGASIVALGTVVGGIGIKLLGLGLTKAGAASRGDDVIKQELDKKFRKLAAKYGTKIPIVRAALYLSVLAFIPIGFTNTGKKWFSSLLTDFTFFGFFDVPYVTDPQGGVRSDISNFVDDKFEWMLLNWFEMSAIEFWGPHGLADPGEQSSYAADVDQQKKDEDIRTGIEDGRLIPTTDSDGAYPDGWLDDAPKE